MHAHAAKSATHVRMMLARLSSCSGLDVGLTIPFVHVKGVPCEEKSPFGRAASLPLLLQGAIVFQIRAMNSIATQLTRAEQAHAREHRSLLKWEKGRKALGREERDLLAKVHVGRNEQPPFAEVKLLPRARRDDIDIASEPFDRSFARRIEHHRFRFVSNARSGFASDREEHASVSSRPWSHRDRSIPRTHARA